ncbi:MAG TPA: inositol monophosphatase family protein [Dongiaceae bacterium]|nr:inositol monophosphatase family protein [Dongiaceae bacterium]
MSSVNLKRALTVAAAAARAAGAVMRRNWRSPKRINKASQYDIKLELDVRCQKLIEKQLAAAFPQIPLLGEEGDSGNVNLAYRWVVDPIDGTVNYAYGIPHAAVCIALQGRLAKPKGGEDYATLVGVIYDPFADELWTATATGPARLNGRVTRVSNHRKLADSLVTTGFAKTKESIDAMLPFFGELAYRVRKIRIMGSAALALTYVASGRLDAYVESRVNLWDIAAGGLILERAGGEFWRQPVVGQQHVYRIIANNGRVRGEIQKLGVFRKLK